MQHNQHLGLLARVSAGASVILCLGACAGPPNLPRSTATDGASMLQFESDGGFRESADSAVLESPASAESGCLNARIMTWPIGVAEFSIDEPIVEPIVEQSTGTVKAAPLCGTRASAEPELRYQLRASVGTYRVHVELESPSRASLRILADSCGQPRCTATSGAGAIVKPSADFQTTDGTIYLIAIAGLARPLQRTTLHTTVAAAAAVPDGGVAGADAEADAAAQSDLAPGASPELVVSELMINPAAVDDRSGEWLELFNAGANAVNLKGWTLRDDGTESHTVSRDVWVSPGGYVVLGQSADAALNGGVAVAYAFAGGSRFTLSNTSDEVILVSPSGTVVDAVRYAAPPWTIPVGKSLSRATATSDGSNAANWCVESTRWPGSAGDSGSPGTPANCTP